MKRSLAVVLVTMGLGAFLFGHFAGSKVEAKSRLPVSAKIKRKVDRGGTEMVDVIVSYRQKPSFAERARTKSLGAKPKREFKHLPMRAMRIPARRLKALAAHPRVRFVTVDAPVEGFLVSAKQTSLVPEAGTAGYVSAESDVVVAVLDSGVGSHNDLKVKRRIDIIPAATYCDEWDGKECEAWETDYDPFGHGTHVAGTLSGNPDGNSTQETFSGVAAGAPIISVRVLDENGRGYASDVLAGLDWVMDNYATYDIRIVNMSLGKAVEEAAADDPLVQAVEALWDNGVVVVCSAGNYGRDGHYTITSPGNSPKVITVGSLTDNGTGSDFTDDYTLTYSSMGPTLFDHVLKPDLLAPGNRVVAAISDEALLKDLLPDRVYASEYLELSGTSMAAAMVSGAAALMLSQEPDLIPATVKARLMRSARKVSGNPAEVGAGVLDVSAALVDSGYTKYAPSPRLARSEKGEVILIEDTSLTWYGDEWGAAYMWSDGNMWSDAYMWSDGYMWSDAYLWSDNYLWSDSYMWSDNYLWSDAYFWSDAYMWSDMVEDVSPLMDLNAAGLNVNDDPQ